MKSADLKIIREQLDNKLKLFKPLEKVSIPNKGWIRAIRDALGMNVKQFARRLKVSSPRITRIEKDEIVGNLTIKTMRHIAEVFNCKFVYGFIPNTSLEDTVQKQAQKIINNRMNTISQTMLLENQELSKKNKNKLFNYEVDELINNSPKIIWENNEEINHKN